MKTKSLHEQITEHVKAGQAIITEAKAAGRDVTVNERKALEGHQSEIQRLADVKAKADADAELFKGFDSYSEASNDDDNTRALSFKGVASRILNADGDSPTNVKSLLAVGSAVTPSDFIDLTVLKERAPVSFMESIPAQVVASTFNYLRETTRTNNAAPVATGGTKPTSVFTLTRVDDKLEVVAHISEPIPEYWIKDNSSLSQWLRLEMVGGLAEAVAAQALTGDGVSPNLHGIALTSGIQLQALVTDALTTIRKAITSLETLSLTPFLVVMNPVTWEAIELLREGGATGGYLLRNTDQALPIDRSKRQVWGVPVALSTSVPSGAGAKAYVLSQDSVKLFTDGVIDFRFGYAAGGFEKNQVVGRAEGRFQMGVLRPAGVVQATVA